MIICFLILNISEKNYYVWHFQLTKIYSIFMHIKLIKNHFIKMSQRIRKKKMKLKTYFNIVLLTNFLYSHNFLTPPVYNEFLINSVYKAFSPKEHKKVCFL